jgi:polyphosphate kinase 2 (PPK2 family)
VILTGRNGIAPENSLIQTLYSHRDHMINVDRFKLGPAVHLGALPTAQAAAHDPAALKEQIRSLQFEVLDLHGHLCSSGRTALLILLHGVSGAGKDRTCRLLAGSTHPHAVAFHMFRHPTPRQRRQDFLWRYHRAAPPRGTIGVFSRSYYEDLLVADKQHVAATIRADMARHVASFESLLESAGTRIVSLLLTISRDTQAERIAERQTAKDRWKRSKFDDIDDEEWSTTQRATETAVNESLARGRPWYYVPCDDRRFSNYVAISIVHAVLSAMRRHDEHHGADGA